VATLRLLPEFEDELRRLPGIIAASVVTGPDATPTEVHVLAEPGKAAKQVVRDVQSYALAKHGMAIDHRIVSVVQIGADEVGIPPHPEIDASPLDADEPPTAPRAAITAIMVRTAGAESEAVVSLGTGGHVFEGRVVGPGAPSLRPRLVAQATLRALDDLLGATVEVESAAVVSVGSREVAVTVLSLMVPRSGEHVVSGSALVRGDESDAVARAVLDALNRQLTG
jgi:hypothetical protein